ncbi:MAG: AAA family ATPase [Candidatus Pacebacteria bacterium]|nr:AAA family ATPase [Candidatus Paceibacterota bacterium]
MKLKSVRIKNYRSIEDAPFEIQPQDDGSFTYGLIGINEAGKSSFLKALALLDDHTNIKPEIGDFHNKPNPITVVFVYEQSDEEISESIKIILESFPESGISNEELKSVTLYVNFEYPSLTKNISLACAYIKSDQKDNIESLLKDHIYKKTHYTIFWKSEDKYLINKEISLSAFSADPDNVSIPLKNCFSLLGLDTKDKIQSKIQEISTDSTERQVLRTDLGVKVTELIKQVWPNHPITITFDISGDIINFHVNDPNGRPRTTVQRSDGFKQFVSFLLNVSSQRETKELSDSLILLDEPETHLHPQAQEYFLSELVKISQGENNICLFATHSNYMIDKNDLSRNYKVIKSDKTNKTSIEKFDKNISTYASVNYEVFGIPSSDYFNQLYGILHERYIDEDAGDSNRTSVKLFDQNYLFTNLQSKKIKKDRAWKGHPDEITFITEIRNGINHYNSTKPKINESELKKGIEYMLELL